MRAKLGIVGEPQPSDLLIATGFLAAMDGQNVDYTLAFRALAEDGATRSPFEAWAPAWRERNPDPALILKNNPLYIPRNHQVEAALTAATEQNDLAPFETLLAVITQPFTERPGLEAFTQPAPQDSEPYRTFCGT